MGANAMFHRAVIRACHNKTLQSAMRNIESDLAPIRDSYQGGAENDRETLDIHQRQVAAMRSGDMKPLASILHEHFRMLEEEFATALHRRWETLFGEVAEQTLRLGSPPQRPCARVARPRRTCETSGRARPGGTGRGRSLWRWADVVAEVVVGTTTPALGKAVSTAFRSAGRPARGAPAGWSGVDPAL